jgi:hypothetical protein
MMLLHCQGLKIHTSFSEFGKLGTRLYGREKLSSLRRFLLSVELLAGLSAENTKPETAGFSAKPLWIIVPALGWSGLLKHADTLELVRPMQSGDRSSWTGPPSSVLFSE